MFGFHSQRAFKKCNPPIEDSSVVDTGSIRTMAWKGGEGTILSDTSPTVSIFFHGKYTDWLDVGHRVSFIACKDGGRLVAKHIQWAE